MLMGDTQSKAVDADELPHYSERTIDWHIGDLEVAGCSVRKDWPHGVVFEVAIGLDRLVALQMANAEVSGGGAFSPSA